MLIKKSGPHAPENKPKPQTSSSAPKREVRNGVIYINGKKAGYTKDHGSSSGGGNQQRPPQTQQQQTPPREKPSTEKPLETRQLTNGGSDGPKKITNRTAPQGGYTISLVTAVLVAVVLLLNQNAGSSKLLMLI